MGVLDEFVAWGDAALDALDVGMGEIVGPILGQPRQGSGGRGRHVDQIHAPARRAAVAVAVPASAKATRNPARVIEATDAETGEVVFIVTNGKTRVECTSRAQADAARETLDD